MQEKSPDELVGDIIDRFMGARNALAFNTILDSGSRRIDLSKPNIHDNKQDFAKERDAVLGAIEGIERALKHVLPSKENRKQNAMFHRLSEAIDSAALRNLSRVTNEAASDLAILNVVQTGYFFNFLFINLKMVASLEERLKELQDQEAQFWSVPNRAPNYYARTIALRLARLYAREKGRAPTFGTSRDGGHPSTDFGRALEAIFEVLGIKARVPNAARWAISQLSDQDFTAHRNAMSHAFPFHPMKNAERTAKEKAVDALTDSAKKEA